MPKEVSEEDVVRVLEENAKKHEVNKLINNEQDGDECNCADDDIIWIQPCCEVKPNHDKMSFDMKGFNKGVSDFSYYAGAITCLLNAGLPLNYAMQMISDVESGKDAKEITRMNCEAEKEQEKRDKVEQLKATL